jgi:hypothetical protein
MSEWTEYHPGIKWPAYDHFRWQCRALLAGDCETLKAENQRLREELENCRDDFGELSALMKSPTLKSIAQKAITGIGQALQESGDE